MTTTRKYMCGLAAVAAALIALPATAQTTAPPAGRLLASNCFQCHGTDGRSGFEEINGKSSTEIYSVPHAQGYTDAQLLKISQYLSTIR